MTPAQQVQLAWAINSLYPGQPALDSSVWTVRDRHFNPNDPGLPVALTLLDRASGKLARVWRGSQTGYDWGRDFDFFFSPSPFGIGRTERGFTDYYGGTTSESGRPFEPVDQVGGHSLGGPAATYDGAVGGVIGGAELLLVATPEPGDADFSAWATPRFEAIYRWENPHDVVPDAPGRFLGYRDLLGPTTVVDFRPLGIDQWDVAGNHHCPNYVAAFKLQNSLQ